MKLKQYYLGCLSHASYLIADERTGVAVVVDPQRDIDQYLADAEQNGWTIKHVFLTHFHADFLAGHIELRERTGARIHLGAKAQAEYAFNGLKEEDTVEFGSVRLRILETPGHTPEGISILVFDLDQGRDSDPMAVLTGDTLFIGDVGRPDLLASIGVTADELANMLYDSIQKLAELPDATKVYPAHGAGSMCGKNLSDDTVSTIGEQKKYNYAMRPMSREEFVKLVEVDQPEAPAYFVYDAMKNREDRPALDESVRRSLQPLDLEAVRRLLSEGAQVLDVRAAIDFEGGHLPGTIHVGLKGKFATWAGSLLSHETPIVVIADPGDEAEAIIRLGRIGFDNAIGYLSDGMASVGDREDLLERTERITAMRLDELSEERDDILVVDVRTEHERRTGAIPGSFHLPLNQLQERVDEIPREKTVVVHCQGGYRSAIAASLLQKSGISNAIDLVGGFQAWESAHQSAA